MQETKYGVLQDGRLIYVPHNYEGAKEIVQHMPEYDEETEYVSVSDYIETDTQIEVVMAKYLLQLDEPEEQETPQEDFEEGSPWEDPGASNRKTLEQKLADLEEENHLLKAQVQASDGRQDFQEELIVELAMMVYAG